MFTNTLFKETISYPRAMAQSSNWSIRFDTILKRYATNSGFNNEQFAQKLEISQRDLFRKVKKTTGYSPHQYIQVYRIQLAMQYLINGKYRTVSETARAVGYTNVGYFIKIFEKEFGKTPLTILKENGWR